MADVPDEHLFQGIDGSVALGVDGVTVTRTSSAARTTVPLPQVLGVRVVRPSSRPLELRVDVDGHRAARLPADDPFAVTLARADLDRATSFAALVNARVADLERPAAPAATPASRGLGRLRRQRS